MMSSPLTHFLDFTIANALHLAGILILAMICLKLLRGAANKLVKPASSQAKAGQQTAQQREAQTQALADKVYGNANGAARVRHQPVARGGDCRLFSIGV